jgi:predicted DCC family thiol-disulfide oxidoreductase YuxK
MASPNEDSAKAGYGLGAATHLGTLLSVQSGHATLVYDGDCGFCTTSALWISRRWSKDGGPEVVPWQRLSHEVILASGLNRDDFARAAWWIDGSRCDEGSRAVARALIAAGGLWSMVGRAILVPPISWVGPLVYRMVARYRYRLPGGTPACKIQGDASNEVRRST